MSRSINPQTQQLAQDLIDPLMPLIAQRQAASRGSAFPTSGMVAGDLFFRTDLGWWCYYDGTRWLTTHAYVADMNNLAGAAGAKYMAELRTDYAPYIERVAIGYHVSTTNNGSNYYTFTVRGVNANYSNATNIHQINTSASAANVWVHSDAAPSLSAIPTHYARFDVDVAQTGSPGALAVLGVTVEYRLVVT